MIKSRKKIISLLFLISLIVASCYDSMTVIENRATQIDQAKNWYDSHILNIRSENTKNQNHVIPDWESAIIVNDGVNKVIEVPLQNKFTVSINDGETIYSISKLLIHKKEDVYKASVMTLIPSNDDVAMLKLNGEKKTLRELFKDYSGYINFTGLEASNFKSSYSIENGKIIRQALSMQALNNSRTDCYSVTTNYYVTVCSIIGCTTSFDYTSTSTYCMYVPDVPTQSDLPPEYSEGGGGGSGADPNSDPIPDQGPVDSYGDINRRFGAQYGIKYRIPVGSTPTAGLTDQQIIQKLIDKLNAMNLQDTYLHDTDNRYSLRPIYYTVSIGNPSTSTTIQNIVDPSQWTLDPIFGNPGTLRSQTNSAAIWLPADSGNAIYVDIFFQKVLPN